MDTDTITHISLCTGYGGIDLALKRVFGERLRTIAYSEIEGFAIANLVSKAQAGYLDDAPIWSDLRSFPWDEFHGLVGILSGGFPCQPFSSAGKRNADSDPRHIFPAILDGISRCRPRLVFLENVEGIISAKLAGDEWRDPAGTSVLLHALRELERVGYCPTAGLFSASETGAPHQRKRTFLLAYDQSVGIQGCGASWLQEPRPHAGQALPVRGGDAGGLADANHQHGHGEERGGNPEAQGVSGEHWQEEHSRWESWGTNAAPAWPSRPGETQHAWEPPRVVSGRQALDDTQERFLRDDSDNQRQAIGEGDTANDSGSCSGEAEAMGNASQREDNGRESRDMGLAPSQGGSSNDAADCTGEGMGNAEQFLLPATREYGAMDEASGISTNGEGGESTQTDPEPGATREREVNGSNASKCSKTQPPLGRDAHGPAGGLDYAELQVTCDNRTDELRLLGNGVVPATAERAFRALIQRFF